jgi:hypothetical protein
MSGVSLSSLMLRDADNENGSDPKAALREQLAKGNIVKEENNGEQDTDDKSDNEGGENEDEGEDAEEDEESDEEEGEDDGTVKDPPEDETDEQKKEREAKEKIEAKATRKQERMQRRIDKAVAAQRTAEAEIARLKAQLEANPDQKLTAEEIEAKAEALATKKAQEKELKDIQAKFEKDCDALQKVANKVDKDFDVKINELAEDIGPIPSFMIGVLSDMDNGGEVLAHVANDDELAEEIWAMKPAKMTRKLVEISNKLADAKKPPKKQISKVPDPGTPVKPSRVVSNMITEADAKNMETYVAKRQRQMAEKRKAQGFN